MKKLLLLTLLLITTVGFSQTQAEYKIGVLADYLTEESQSLFQRLQQEIVAVVGEDTRITFPESARLLNQNDQNLANNQYAQLLEADVDIILAFGPVNNLVISKQASYPKPVILFGAVNQDLIDIDLSKQTSGVENFTYLIQPQSLAEDLTKFRELASFTRVGVAVERPIASLLPYENVLAEVFKDGEITYQMIPFDTVDDIIGSLEQVDALYLSGGFFLSEEEVKQLATACIDGKKPSFSANGISQVKNGFLATYQSDDTVDRFFRRIALNIEAFVTGTPLSELNVYLKNQPRVTVNYNTAQYIGVPLRYSLIGETDFVGEFRNVLSERSYDLLQVIDQVVTNNLSLQVAGKDVDLQGQEVKSAKSNYLPNLTAAASGTYTDPDLAAISNGQNPEFQTAGNITLKQTLFSEAANANISIQKKLELAQQQNFLAEQLNIILDGASAYFNALILKANAQIQIRNLDLTKRNLQIAEQNFKAGEAGKTDMLRFQSQMAQNTQSMIESINSLDQGFIGLNQVLNNPVDSEIDVDDVSLDDSIFQRYNYDQFINLLDDPSLRDPFIDFLVTEAMANSPELKSIQFSQEATDRNLKLAGTGRFLPTLALQGQYNRILSRSGVGSMAPNGTSFLNDNYNVGLSVSIPLVNQNLNNINKETAQIQLEQLQLNQQNIELSLAANVRSGVLNLVNQVSNIELSKVSEETARQSLELTQASYESGAVNIIQLIDAQNNYLNAQLSRVNAVYNYLLQSLQLERFLGFYFLLQTPEESSAFLERFLEFRSNRN